jgi:hypothetical protein
MDQFSVLIPVIFPLLNHILHSFIHYSTARSVRLSWFNDFYQPEPEVGSFARLFDSGAQIALAEKNTAFAGFYIRRWNQRRRRNAMHTSYREPVCADEFVIMNIFENVNLLAEPNN